jgi:hypothetical protein
MAPHAAQAIADTVPDGIPASGLDFVAFWHGTVIVPRFTSAAISGVHSQ